MNKSSNKDKGSIAIIFAVMMVVFISFLGLALDFGYAYLQKTRLQQVADAEALACAINPPTNPCPSVASDQYPALNPYGFTISIQNPGNNSLCLTSTQGNCVKATAQTPWVNFFLSLSGNLSTSAIAGRIALPSCMITTSYFSSNGTNRVSLNNCAASIGGTLSASGQSGITITNSGSITVFNGNPINNCPYCSPAPTSSQNQLPQIPASTFPTTNLDGTPLPTRSYNQCTSPITCIPAIYTGQQVSLNFDGQLQSGNYVFQGGFSTNGHTITSSTTDQYKGVALYIPGNKTLDLSGTVTLSAPTIAGCTAGSGIVISHPYTGGSYNSLILNGAQNHLNITGVTNLSADDITINGSSAGLNWTGSILSHSITLHGNMYPQVSQNPCFNLYESNGKVVLIN